MIYRSRWHEIDDESLLMFLALVILIVGTVGIVIFTLKEQDYKHELELKKIELCKEEDK